MSPFLVKVLLSALVIAAVAEIGRRSTLMAAVLASLPLTSILAMVWMHIDGVAPQQIAQLSRDIVWLVLPSLLLFLTLPALLARGHGFWPSLLAACVVTVVGYAAVLLLLRTWIRLP
jgi:hypothetical protein